VDVFVWGYRRNLPILFFPRFFRRLGLRNVFVCSIFSCAVIFVIFPFENLATLAGGGPNVVVWMLIMVQLLSLCFFDSGYRKFFSHHLSSPHADADDMDLGTLSYNVHVHFVGRAEQTVTRRSEWPWAGGDIHSELYWTRRRWLAICVLPDA
jgi:hypothetical protein